MELAEEDKKKKKSMSHLRPVTPDYNEVKHAGQRPYPEYNELNDFDEEVGAGHFEPMSEGYMGGRDNVGPNQCPLLDAMEKRCRGIDLLSGDINQVLLPVCGIHQMCYLCVSISIIY